ncbi:MAG: MATE family efflux transporter [Clostridia bacterium]|nr:MATE family efflux transporter [Clostridia bacterium]
MADHHTTDLTRGRIWPQLIRFAVPLMLGNLFQLSYNMVDTIVIGRFAGSAALAAVGSCDQIMNLLILGVSGVCIGASVLMGNFFGARDGERLLDEMKTTVAMGMIFALLVMVAGLPLAPLIFRLMNIQPEAMNDASVYLRIIFLGMPFTCLYNIYSAALRSVGDSKTPVRYLVLSCLINIGLDLLLVIVVKLGVAGAALATVTAQGISALLCIAHVNRNVPELRFGPRSLRINRGLARKTLSYGILTALQQCAQPIGNIIIQGSVNTLGVTAAAAYSAVRKIEDIGLLPGRSISTAMTAFLAQNEGAGNHDRTAEGYRKGMTLELCVGLVISAVVLLLRAPLMSLFTTDESMVLLGVHYFDVIGFCYWLPHLSNGLQGYYRGTGSMKASLLGSLTQISVRVLVTLLLVPTMGIGGVGIACVAGWFAMLLWGLPWARVIQRRLSERSKEKSPEDV